MVVEKLSLFNNLNFTKKQWEIILAGCGCPKSNHFWAALRNNNLVLSNKMYTLVDMDIHSYAVILEQYNKMNRDYVNKCYKKKKAREKVSKMKQVNLTFYLVNGALSSEKPERE